MGQQHARLMEALMGPDGKLVAWLAPADEHTVVFAYVDKESVRRTTKAIKEGKPGLMGDAGVTKTAALLPRGGVAVLI